VRVNKGVKPLGFLMRNPHFGTLLVVNLVSSLVGAGVGIALSVHLYQLTGSPLWTAVLAATPTVAGVAFGHLAGTVTDRWGAPLRIMRIALFLRVLVLMALFAVANSPLGLICAVFAQAAVQQPYTPAEQVPRRRLRHRRGPGRGQRPELVRLQCHQAGGAGTRRVHDGMGRIPLGRSSG
jgi:hypothetical protein